MNDTIVAVSTPKGVGGIGIVRISGPNALFIAKKIFSADRFSKIANTKELEKPNYVNVGFVFDPESNEKIDTCLLIYFKEPHSYTGEDVVELQMHGGIKNLDVVVGLCISCGARVAERGEFTKRAFMNGKMNLLEAGSVIELIEAKTDKALKIASKRLFGELSDMVRDFRESVIRLIALIEAPIDFPFDADREPREEIIANIDELKGTILKFLSTYNAGRAFSEGVKVVIAGKPNVGKSTLMNALLKFDRVIVSEIPGTTRDTVEEVIDFYGLPVRLVDTAGLHSTSDDIENLGIERTKKALEGADLVLFVFDAGESFYEEEHALKSFATCTFREQVYSSATCDPFQQVYSSATCDPFQQVIDLTEGKNRIIVLNKSDVPQITTREKLQGLFKGEEIVEISALLKQGLFELEEKIYKKIIPNDFDTPLIATEREKAIFTRILSHLTDATAIAKNRNEDELIVEELKSVVEDIGELSGDNISEDILRNIFSRFCIGK